MKSICVGIAGWCCLLTSGNERDLAELRVMFQDSLLDGSTDGLSTVHVDLSGVTGPTFVVHCLTAKIDSMFTNPEGKRFKRLDHGEQIVYTDDAIDFDVPMIQLRGNEICVLDRRFWQTYLLHILTWIMLQEKDLVLVHAGVCAANGVGIVIVGPSGSGKSTLCQALSHCGAEFYSDECAIFGANDRFLYAWTHRVSLRPGGIALLESCPQNGVADQTKQADPKLLIKIARPEAPCPHKAVIFFVDGFGPQERIGEISGRDATMKLVRLLAYGSAEVLFRVEAAADIVSKIPCLSLTIGKPLPTAHSVIEVAKTYSSTPHC